MKKCKDGDEKHLKREFYMFNIEWNKSESALEKLLTDNISKIEKKSNCKLESVELMLKENENTNVYTVWMLKQS